VTARYRNCTVLAGVSPDSVVLDCSVEGIASQVFPPSLLYCHS
jgi:hypothetical protein